MEAPAPETGYVVVVFLNFHLQPCKVLRRQLDPQLHMGVNPFFFLKQ